MKTCTKCGETMPLDNFNNDQSRKGGKHPWCKPCARQKRNAWYEANREANLRYQADWRAANKDKKADSDRRWRENNLERKRENDRAWREANPDRQEANIRAYRESNPDRVRTWRGNRRARRANAYVAPVVFDEILQRDLGVCGICHRPVMDARPELDHIIPLAAGGTHEPDNIQLAHRACNRRKAAKVNYTPAEAA